MCDPYILLQLRGTTLIDPPHSIHTRTGSGKIGEERRRSSLTRGLARASPGRSCCSCARASSYSFVRASSLASLASLLSSLRSLGTFVIGRSSWGARTKLLLAVLSGLRSGPEECQQHPAETRRIAAANCVPRIAPTHLTAATPTLPTPLLLTRRMRTTPVGNLGSAWWTAKSHPRRIVFRWSADIAYV